MKKVTSLFASLALSSITTIAAAGPYVGANIGQADYDTPGFDDPTSYTILAGYNVTENFGLEMSYTDFGESDDGIAPVWTLDGDGFGIAAVGKYPLAENFEIFAKLGLIDWEVSLDEDGYGELAKADGTDVTIALGAAYSITTNLDLVAQYQTFEADSDGDSSDVTNLSIGLNYNF